MPFCRRECWRWGVIMLFLPIFSSCETNPSGPFAGPPFITPHDYRDVIIAMIDFNRVSVTRREGFDLRSPNVAWVSVGTKDSNGFTPSMTIPSTYSPGTQSYVVHFDFVSNVDESQINAPFTIRYYSADSTFVDVDTSVATFQYPYQGTQVVLQSAFPDGFYQDVDRIDSKLYYHPLGPMGLYEYDLNTHQITDLIDYSSGDHIAADSPFVFCDIGHNRVYRFNLAKNAIDLTFPPINPAWEIAGLATENGLLYELLYYSPMYIKVYTTDGIPVDSIPYEKYTYYISVHDSILYGQDANSQIVRFDLRTRSFLPNLVAPSNEFEGIKIYGDQLYFCDDPRSSIGVIPLSDLSPIAGASKLGKVIIKRASPSQLKDERTERHSLSISINAIRSAR